MKPKLSSRTTDLKLGKPYGILQIESEAVLKKIFKILNKENSKN